MTVPDEIRSFLQSAVTVSLGYSQINFFDVENLEEEQIRYRFDSKGKPLILVLEYDTWDEDDNWETEWLAIGRDQVGDPIIIIVNIDWPELPVLTGVYGKGCWEVSYIADSLENFNEIISLLRELSTKRATPDGLKENPISNEEYVDTLNKIERENLGSNMWFWIYFLKNEQNNFP